jgi:hypothetical protein
MDLDAVNLAQRQGERMKSHEISGSRNRIFEVEEGNILGLNYLLRW